MGNLPQKISNNVNLIGNVKNTINQIIDYLGKTKIITDKQTIIANETSNGTRLSIPKKPQFLKAIPKNPFEIFIGEDGNLWIKNGIVYSSASWTTLLTETSGYSETNIGKPLSDGVYYIFLVLCSNPFVAKYIGVKYQNFPPSYYADGVQVILLGKVIFSDGVFTQCNSIRNSNVYFNDKIQYALLTGYYSQNSDLILGGNWFNNFPQIDKIKYTAKATSFYKWRVSTVYGDWEIEDLRDIGSVVYLFFQVKINDETKQYSGGALMWKNLPNYTSPYEKIGQEHVFNYLIGSVNLASLGNFCEIRQEIFGDIYIPFLPCNCSSSSSSGGGGGGQSSSSPLPPPTPSSSSSSGDPSSSSSPLPPPTPSSSSSSGDPSSSSSSGDPSSSSSSETLVDVEVCRLKILGTDIYAQGKYIVSYNNKLYNLFSTDCYVGSEQPTAADRFNYGWAQVQALGNIYTDSPQANFGILNGYYLIENYMTGDNQFTASHGYAKKTSTPSITFTGLGLKDDPQFQYDETWSEYTNYEGNYTFWQSNTDELAYGGNGSTSVPQVADDGIARYVEDSEMQGYNSGNGSYYTLANSGMPRYIVYGSDGILYTVDGQSWNTYGRVFNVPLSQLQ